MVKLNANNPQTAAFIILKKKPFMYSEHTGYVRTVFSYW